VFLLPGLLIGLEALTGVEALARVDLAYLVSNLVVGLVVLAGGLALATRYANHSRVVDALSGRGLRRMEAHLAELAKFQREP
jgi:hypothetical protein